MYHSHTLHWFKSQVNCYHTTFIILPGFKDLHACKEGKAKRFRDRTPPKTTKISYFVNDLHALTKDCLISNTFMHLI